MATYPWLHRPWHVTACCSVKADLYFCRQSGNFTTVPRISSLVYSLRQTDWCLLTPFHHLKYLDKLSSFRLLRSLYFKLRSQGYSKTNLTHINQCFFFYVLICQTHFPILRRRWRYCFVLQPTTKCHTWRRLILCPRNCVTQLVRLIGR